MRIGLWLTVTHFSDHSLSNPSFFLTSFLQDKKGMASDQKVRDQINNRLTTAKVLLDTAMPRVCGQVTLLCPAESLHQKVGTLAAAIPLKVSVHNLSRTTLSTFLVPDHGRPGRTGLWLAITN